MGFLVVVMLCAPRERAHATRHLLPRRPLYDNTQQDESLISFAVANLPLRPFLRCSVKCTGGGGGNGDVVACQSVRRLITTAIHARSAGLPFQKGKKNLH